MFTDDPSRQVVIFSTKFTQNPTSYYYTVFHSITMVAFADTPSDDSDDDDAPTTTKTVNNFPFVVQKTFVGI